MKFISNIFNEISQLSKNTEFMPTGIQKIDNELDGGFMRKELIVLGGYTGSGKSFVSGQIFLNIARAGFKAGYFSLEISNEMVVSRLIGQWSNIKPTRIMAGLLSPDENNRKIEAKAKLVPYENYMFFADDTYRLKDIIAHTKANKLDFVVVDFIQNVMGEGSDEYARLSNVALDLQKMAKELNCCVLVVSQLSNSANRGGYVEYKGSGSIATVCDLGFFITRDEKIPEDISLNLKKNRRGVSGIAFELKFMSPGGRIYEKF